MTKSTRWKVVGPTTFDEAGFATGDWHTIRDEDGTLGELHLRVARADNGRIAITGLVLEAQPITATGLRQIDVGGLLQAIADHDAAALNWRDHEEIIPDVVPSNDWMPRNIVDTVESTVSETPIQSKRGEPVSDDAYRQFAETYARFSAYPDPIRRTCEALFISRATAHRRLNEVRRRELLDREEDR